MQRLSKAETIWQMSYVDTNMVRAGAVSHPSMWPFCCYNEIQEPQRKNMLIDYKQAKGLFETATYEQLRSSHKGSGEEYLGNRSKNRQDEWTHGIAVGSRHFVEKVKNTFEFSA